MKNFHRWWKGEEGEGIFCDSKSYDCSKTKKPDLRYPFFEDLYTFPKENGNILDITRLLIYTLLLELIFFFRFSMSSGCNIFTNFLITCLFSLVLFLPNGKWWQPSVSLDVMTILESLHILITFCSRSLSETSSQIPDISTVFHLLYCSVFACNFCKAVIWFSRLALT